MTVKTMPVADSVKWGLRRGFWNAFMAFKFEHNTVATVEAPPVEEGRLQPVALASVYPDIPIYGITFADDVPADEAVTKKSLFTSLQAQLYKRLPPMQPGLPPIAADPNEALSQAYPPSHRRGYRFPRRPRELTDGIDLGGLAVAGPYAGYLHATAEGGFRWDLAMLDRFECHDGLRGLGAVVEFRLDKEAGRLKAVGIDCELGRTGPSDPDWDEAARLALCAATTHLSLVRHFSWIHLVAGAQLAMATRNHLPSDHPVRRLLWPHVFGTQAGNRLVTPALLMPGGDFETVFSFTHRGLCRLYEETVVDFDLRLFDPASDASRRGVAGAGFGFETPALDMRLDLMKVIRDHVTRYLRLYYAADDAPAGDEPFAAWWAALDEGLPGGVSALAGPGITRRGAARLLSTLIYLVTVEHEIVGSGLWDYQLWSDVHPVRVYRDGSRPPLDVYQRLVNADFTLNVDRTPLMSDFSGLAVDHAGEQAFLRFLSDLRALQGVSDSQPRECWWIEPKILKANINA